MDDDGVEVVPVRAWLLLLPPLGVPGTFSRPPPLPTRGIIDCRPLGGNRQCDDDDDDDDDGLAVSWCGGTFSTGRWLVE